MGWGARLVHTYVPPFSLVPTAIHQSLALQASPSWLPFVVGLGAGLDPRTYATMATTAGLPPLPPKTYTPRRPVASAVPGRVDVADLTPNNAGQLRKLNAVLFPVRFSEKWYKDVLGEEVRDVCKFGRCSGDEWRANKEAKRGGRNRGAEDRTCKARLGRRIS